MTIQQEAYEKIMQLPDDGVRLIIVLADEIARQHGVTTDTSSTQDNLVSTKQLAFQKMAKMRESSVYSQNINYKKVMEESVSETYNISN